MRVDDIVMVVDPDAVRGKYAIGRVIEVYPESDGRIRNVKVKTPASKHQ